jgi:hypothetical protein
LAQVVLGLLVFVAGGLAYPVLEDLNAEHSAVSCSVLDARTSHDTHTTEN